MKIPLNLAAACTLLLSHPAAAAAPASPVADSSYVLAGGERVLQQSVEIAAPVARVWEAFATTEGYRSWVAPAAKVDFRLGGMMEAIYGPGAKLGDPGTIRNAIVAYVPQRMLAIRNVQAPPKTDFDVATFQRLHTVILFEPLASDRTRVTIAVPGFGSGADDDVVYKFFAAGNRYSLKQLKKALER